MKFFSFYFYFNFFNFYNLKFFSFLGDHTSKYAKHFVLGVKVDVSQVLILRGAAHSWNLYFELICETLTNKMELRKIVRLPSN